MLSSAKPLKVVVCKKVSLSLPYALLYTFSFTTTADMDDFPPPKTFERQIVSGSKPLKF